MAPISLSILNPVAFVLMEIQKQKDLSQEVTTRGQLNLCTAKLLKQIIKGIFYNPILMMTILGIIGNAAFKHQISIYIEGLLQVYLVFDSNPLILHYSSSYYNYNEKHVFNLVPQNLHNTSQLLIKVY